MLDSENASPIKVAKKPSLKTKLLLPSPSSEKVEKTYALFFSWIWWGNKWGGTLSLKFCRSLSISICFSQIHFFYPWFVGDTNYEVTQVHNGDLKNWLFMARKQSVTISTLFNRKWDLTCSQATAFRLVWWTKTFIFPRRAKWIMSGITNFQCSTNTIRNTLKHVQISGYVFELFPEYV